MKTRKTHLGTAIANISRSFDHLHGNESAGKGRHFSCIGNHGEIRMLLKDMKERKERRHRMHDDDTIFLNMRVQNRAVDAKRARRALGLSQKMNGAVNPNLFQAQYQLPGSFEFCIVVVLVISS